MRAYDMAQDFRWPFNELPLAKLTDPEYLVEQIAGMSASLEHAHQLAAQFAQALRQLATTIEQTDWERGRRDAIQDRDQWLTQPTWCYQCRQPIPRSEAFWPEYGAHQERLHCKTCAQAQEDAYWDAPWACERCSRRVRYRDLQRVDADDSPYARTGAYCDGCVEWARTALRRDCTECSTAFRVTSTASRLALCPSCRLQKSDNEARVVNKHVKHARSHGLEATLTVEEWVQTLRDYRGLCAYCQKSSYEVLEHFVPVSRGGGTTVRNCLPACTSCNTAKGDENPLDILASAISEPDFVSMFTRVQRSSYMRLQAYLEARG